MELRVIAFIPPVIGIEGAFNTFRLGLFYSKRLQPGETVILLNEKEKITLGTATVERVEVGALEEMLRLHAHANHTQIGLDALSAPDRLAEVVRKIYGPHIATPARKVSVIYLKRSE